MGGRELQCFRNRACRDKAHVHASNLPRSRLRGGASGTSPLQGFFDQRAFMAQDVRLSDLRCFGEVSEFSLRLGGLRDLLLSHPPGQTLLVRSIAFAGTPGLLPRPCGRHIVVRGGVHHLDAVHRAGRQAQFTACAFGGDDGVHPLVAASDGIDGACIETQSAADAPCFVNEGQLQWPFVPTFWIQGLGGSPCQLSKAVNTFLPSGGASIDVGLTTGDGLCICTAILIAATGALCLRQGIVNVLDGGGWR